MIDAPRRRLLGAVAAAGALGAIRGASAHEAVGRLDPPQSVPSVRLTTADGRRTALEALLAGRATALQLMFTGCSASCPIQGAQFAQAARMMRADDAAAPQLVSVSIDALGDTPESLLRWQQRHLAAVPAHWRAAVPAVADADRLLDFLQGRSRGPDRHTAQVYFFDARARLVVRSVDFPPVPEIVAQLARIDRARA
ncbi:MAG: SCO family protein [Burkholderiales bacterium]